MITRPEHSTHGIHVYLHSRYRKRTHFPGHNISWVKFSRGLIQSTSGAESWKAVEAHGCKPWVTNLSIIPHTLGLQTANTTYCIILLQYINKCQVNMSMV